MYEITFADDKKYTGEYGPVTFVEGIATTDKPWIATWFEGRGFRVTKKEVSPFESMGMDQLKALCVEKGIEFNAKAKKETLIKLLEGAD